MVIAKHPVRCKLVNDNEIIKQTSEVNYLGIKLTNDGNTEREITEQLMKANRIIEYLDQCFSTAGPREVLLEFVILVF
jgi:hypothetical protein